MAGTIKERPRQEAPCPEFHEGRKTVQNHRGRDGTGEAKLRALETGNGHLEKKRAQIVDRQSRTDGDERAAATL